MSDEARKSWVAFPFIQNFEEIDIDTYGELNHESVNNTADHGDKVKGVPVVFEVALKKKKIGKLAEAFTFSRSMQRSKIFLNMFALKFFNSSHFTDSKIILSFFSAFSLFCNFFTL